jgi:hypothetical protein
MALASATGTDVSDLLKRFLEDEEADFESLPLERGNQGSHAPPQERGNFDLLALASSPMENSQWAHDEDDYVVEYRVPDQGQLTKRSRGPTRTQSRPMTVASKSDPLELSLYESHQWDYFECTVNEQRAAKQLEAAAGVAHTNENGERYDGNAAPQRTRKFKSVAKVKSGANKSGKQQNYSRAHPPSGPPPPQLRIYQVGLETKKKHEMFIQRCDNPPPTSLSLNFCHLLARQRPVTFLFHPPSQ